MRATVTLALCLFGLTFAAEDNSTRKSRQILHPVVQLFPGSHSVYSLGHHQHHAPAVQYLQPAVHSVVHGYSHPQVFSGHYDHPHYFQSGHHFQQGGPQSGFQNEGSPNGYQLQGAPQVTEPSEQSEQYGGPSSPRPYLEASESFQPLISPSQDASEELRFGAGSSLSQDLRESPDLGQSPVGQSAYRPSPRLYGPSQATVHYPANSQPSSQPQQQTRAFFSGTFDQQSSSPAQASQQGAPTPILSQSGQIRNDGSYNYGFQSANGIQSTETGEMRPGVHRYVQGSYSYTAPDGTPISAEYYADETGFHVRGDHIPTGAGASSNFQQPSGQNQQPSGQYRPPSGQYQQLSSVQSN